MDLWKALYALVWIALIEFLIAMTPGVSTVMIYLHIAIGVIIIGLTFNNFSCLRNTRVPGRVKRIAQASYNLSISVAVLGVLIYFKVGSAYIIPLMDTSIYGLILFFHVLISFAIITQAAAVAIAYDMWEDHEFEKETQPGEIPPLKEM